MHFEESLLTGMVKPFPVVDRMLCAQGFTRRGNIDFTYDMRIEDAASRTMYYLRIPTHYARQRANDRSLLQLDQPYIGKYPGPNRFQRAQAIPNEIVEAAQHKVAEIASYLSTVR
ncbi:hypothetical protein [Numidum massiliense]|uniref:hypothetical protein n=1 Tax=Numidum massiliense TaxID=1522315 RepID=UPI0006D55047|nr:hypothetical protein [Numidum massiliense]